MYFLFICIYFILNFILASLAVEKVPGNVMRIIGGQEAPVGFGRFHASLQNLTGHHVCGGAVISNWHVVTAAHCVQGADPANIKAVVGTTNLDVGGKTYDVESVNIYDEFNFGTKRNDVALLKVKGPFDLQYVQIINLNEKELIDGDIVFLSGFGAQQVNGESSRLMHVLTLPVFQQETCRFAMRYTREVTDEMFCTFTNIGQGTCYGDSGGPIIKDDKLVGLVSWGIPCAVGFPDVHTRVAPYVGWIKNITRNDYCIKPKAL